MKKFQNNPDSDKWINSQRVLGAELKKLCWRLKKQYPGVWRCQGIDDLLALAEDLPGITNKGVEIRIQGWWQPELKLTYEPAAGPADRFSALPPAELPAELFDEENERRELVLCPVCGDRYTRNSSGVCPVCLQMMSVDDNTAP